MDLFFGHAQVVYRVLDESLKRRNTYGIRSRVTDHLGSVL